MRLAVIIVTITVLLLLAMFTNIFRILKSVVLILQVTPYEQTVPGAPVILVVGDSTGYGTGAGKKEASVAGQMGADFPNYTIVNNSKNGRTIQEALVVLQTLQTDAHFELILLQIGANDILQKREIEVVERDLTELYVVAKKHSPQVVMLSNGNIGASYAFKGKTAEAYTLQSRIFRATFIEAAKKHGVSYIDLFEEPENDVFVQDPKKYTAFDGLHPTSEGYAVWYLKLRPALETILQ